MIPKFMSGERFEVFEMYDKMPFDASSTKKAVAERFVEGRVRGALLSCLPDPARGLGVRKLTIPPHAKSV
jgi:hypothetical protein